MWLHHILKGIMFNKICLVHIMSCVTSLRTFWIDLVRGQLHFTAWKAGWASGLDAVEKRIIFYLCSLHWFVVCDFSVQVICIGNLYVKYSFCLSICLCVELRVAVQPLLTQCGWWHLLCLWQYFAFQDTFLLLISSFWWLYIHHTWCFVRFH
jgi:hypothetical protein